MKISEIKVAFREHALQPETLFLLAGEQAIAFIERCCAAGIVLAGVEGFSVTEIGAVQPEQLQSNDIAESSLSQQDFIRETIQMIQAGLSGGYYYEVVVNDEDC